MLFSLFMLLMAITLAAVGQVLLKAGLSQLKNPTIVQTMVSMFHNVTVFFGYAAFVLSSLVWLIALRRLPLSYAYPMVSLGYVVVVLLSWRIFHETIPPLRIVALVVILAGVLLLALSESAKTPQPASAPTAAPMSQQDADT